MMLGIIGHFGVSDLLLGMIWQFVLEVGFWSGSLCEYVSEKMVWRFCCCIVRDG